MLPRLDAARARVTLGMRCEGATACRTSRKRPAATPRPPGSRAGGELGRAALFVVCAAAGQRASRLGSNGGP